MPEVKRRRPWLAALANFVLPPLGHMYVGRLGRGIALGLLLAVLGLLLVGPAMMRLAGNAATAAALLLLAILPPKVLLPLDAWWIARREGAAYRLRRSNRWYAYLGMAVLTVAALELTNSVMRTYVVQSYKIPSSSMEPTLRLGDHIMVDKRAYLAGGPGRFDLVAFENPEEPEKKFVQRVVALPGETVEIRAKKVLVDGVPLDEPHAYIAEGSSSMASRDALPPQTLGPDQYFVLGDNRDRSYDSRFWGPLPRAAILGRVTLRYFPLDRFGALG